MLLKSCVTDVNIDTTFPAMHLIYQSSIQLQFLHWAEPSSTALRKHAWNSTKEPAFIPLTYWRLFALCLSLSVLWFVGPYSGHGLPSFLPQFPFIAAYFSFVHGAGRVNPSVHYSPTCYVIFLLASYLRNFLLKPTLECDGLPNL